MKSKRILSRLITLTTVITLGVSLLLFANSSPTKVEAAQHINNYASYTYTGDYYDDIDFNATGGMNGELRTSLTTLIKPAGFYIYSSTGETHLSTQLQYADEDPTNSNNMVMLYTRDSRTKVAATVSGKVKWNREHVWCKNRSNTNWKKDDGAEDEAGTDILHLRPTYSGTNSSRGDTKYGDISKANPKYFDIDTEKVTTDSSKMLWGYSNSSYFEPLDAVKGDVARIIMYVWTTYTGWVGKKTYQPLNILDIFQSYDTLLRWHTQDKPDTLEGNRNNYAQTSRQKNRNPFVDHPELAWKIFGDQASASVKEACMNAYPASNGSGEQITPTGINLNRNTADMKIGKTLQLNATLEPNGATGTITWLSNNTNVATVNNSGLVTAKQAGNATITASVGNYSASCVITVTDVNYGSYEHPLTVSDAIDIIDDLDGATSSQPLYVKGIVTSSSYNSQYQNYEIWLQSEDGETLQAFELFRAKIDTNRVTGDYTASNALQGKEVIAYGYAKKYNTTYELCTSSNEPTSPLVISVANPPGVTLNANSLNIKTGESSTLVATLTPSDPLAIYEWSSSDEDIAVVNDNGVVTGLSKGNTTIKVKVNDTYEAECLVRVSSISGNSTFETTNVINVDDVVYLTSNAVNMQYDGPSSTSTIYGIGSEYTSEPDTDGISLTVCEGSQEDTYSFKINSGTYINKYLAWSSGNSLKVDTTISDNSSWVVSFDENNNATIANVADNTRIIWWNVGSPRFACYTDKTDGASYKYIQLWKTISNNPNPEDYLAYSSKITGMTAHEEVASEDNITDSLIFNELGLNSNIEIPSVDFGDVYFASESSPQSTSVPKYMRNDQAFHVYTGNTIWVSSDNRLNIFDIHFTFLEGSTDNLEINGNTGGAFNNNNTWIGSHEYVSFRCTGNVVISRIDVVHSDIVSVNSVALRFGVSIPKVNYDAITTDGHIISDYGVMFVKKDTLRNTYNTTSIADAYHDGRDLAAVHSNRSTISHVDGYNYFFTAKIKITLESNYNTYYCAAPFIVIDDEYYFLPQMEASVSNIAWSEYYGYTSNTTFSKAALHILIGI